jgi:hypothetical protein
LPVASTALLAKISDRFSAAVHRLSRDQQVPWVDFARGQRRDDVMHVHLAKLSAVQGVVFVGRAQEETTVFRTEKRRDTAGLSYPWVGGVHRDGQPLLVLLRGPGLRPVLRHVLPNPFTDTDRAAGYRYDMSVLQAELCLTQMLDRPVSGRIFFEQVIRDNLDIGRPDQVTLVFNRRLFRKGPHPTPGRFRTRVITDGVTPSLHVDYQHTTIKGYHTDGRCEPRPPPTTPAASTSADVL